MWNIMLYRELECVPCLVKSEISAINSSPWRNPLLMISSGKVFLRTVERREKSKQMKNSVLNTFKNG